MNTHLSGSPSDLGGNLHFAIVLALPLLSDLTDKSFGVLGLQGPREVSFRAIFQGLCFPRPFLRINWYTIGFVCGHETSVVRLAQMAVPGPPGGPREPPARRIVLLAARPRGPSELLFPSESVGLLGARLPASALRRSPCGHFMRFPTIASLSPCGLACLRSSLPSDPFFSFGSPGWKDLGHPSQSHHGPDWDSSPVEISVRRLSTSRHPGRIVENAIFP